MLDVLRDSCPLAFGQVELFKHIKCGETLGKANLSDLRERGFVALEKSGSFLKYVITDVGISAIVRYHEKCANKDDGAVVMPIQDNIFLRDIYMPSKANSYYRNNGNEHIKSRGPF